LKKGFVRICAFFALAVVMMALVSACRNESGSDNAMPEFVYVPEVVSLPSEIEEITGVAATDDTVFFATSHWSEDGGIRVVQLFALDLATNEISELTGYSPHKPLPDARGWLQVSMTVDNEGNLWVLETGNFWHINVPEDFEGGEDEHYQFFEDLGNVNSIRKLDSSGAEATLLSLDAISQGTQWFNVISFEIDSSGNFYVIAMGDTPLFGDHGSAIFVLDESANLLSTIPSEEGWGQLLRIADGSVAHFGWFFDSEFGGRQMLHPIDLQTQSFGDAFELPANIWTIFPGNEDFDLLFMEGNTDLAGFNFGDEEPEFLLNWIDSDVLAGSFNNITLLPDGRIFTALQQWGRDGSTFEIILLTRTRSADLPERSIITLAALWLDTNLQNAIVEFNRTSTTHRIRVTDYSQFNTSDDAGAGLTRLTTDLIAGIVPDILSIQGLPVRQYVARGLLLDLYEFIDADPEFSRNSFVEGVFEAAEMDGGLYYVFSSFNLSTLIGHPSVLGSQPGWNIDEFTSVIAAHPNADMPLGNFTRSQFLTESITLGIDQYVDWATGEVRFDTGEFASLLEFAATFPEEFDHAMHRRTVSEAAIAIPMPEGDGETSLIAQGRQIMTQTSIWDFQTLQMNFASFGGELVFKGFPTEGRNGHSIRANGGLAITTGASDRDAAWSFLRTFLSESSQRDIWDFPTNRAAFDAGAAEAMAPVPEDFSHVWWVDGVAVELRPLTQAQMDLFIEAIRLAPGVAGWDQVILDIVTEGADDFFSGRGSAQDAARVIQSRVSIYVAEQS